jgi:hypothetical protein
MYTQKRNLPDPLVSRNAGTMSRKILKEGSPRNNSKITIDQLNPHGKRMRSL